MNLRIAFAGTGYINKIHAQAAKTCGAELVAVVNHKPASMAAFAGQFGIARQYGTVEEMLKDGKVDGLVVSTPNYLHAAQAIAALEAGVHVMVEKPMAMNATEAERMCSSAEKSGSLLMVAHCFRFDREAIWLKENSEKIGKIVRTKGYGVHIHWGPGGWFTEKRFAGGGAMADMGIHALDTARFLLGDPQPISVFARIGTYYGAYNVDDTGIILVNWDNGATSYIESGWWQAHTDGPQAATQLYGVNGFASLFPTRIETPNADRDGLEVLDPGFPFPRQEQCPQSMYDDQMAYFFNCIQTNNLPVPGGLEGWVNMRVVDAAYESAETGKEVDL